MEFMSDPFQRLTAGGTFRRTFQIFSSRYDLFLSISTLMVVPLLAMPITGFSSELYAVESTVFMLFAVAGMASMSYATAELYVGQNPTCLASLRQGFSRWCTVVGATMLASLGLTGCAISVYALLVVCFVIEPSALWVFDVCASLIGMTSLVFVCYAYVSLMILLPVIMVERRGLRDSIKRCWELSSNNRCYIVCTTFCLAVSCSAVQAALAAILAAAGGRTEAVHWLWAGFVMTLPAMVSTPLAIM
jgi:hypothetical protein